MDIGGQLRLTSLVTIFILCPFTSCINQKFTQRLNEAEQQVRRNQGILQSSKNLPTKQLSWSSALQQLNAQNLSLIQAQSSLEQLKVSRRKFAINQFNPRISAISSLSTALGDIGDFGSNNSGIRLLGSISIPNPLSVYARRYALELQYYMRSIDLALLERRLQVSLYTHFLQQDIINNEKAELNQDDQLHILTPSELAQNKRSAHKKKRTTSNSTTSLRLQLNRLLNTPGHNWEPLPQTLPDLNYTHELSALKFSNGYGQLAIQQAAGQLESAFAGVARLKINKFPSFSTGVSIPTLYNSQSADDNFDFEETRLFASISKTINLNGSDAKNIKRAQERASFIQHSLIQRLESEQYKLSKLIQNYQDLITEQALIQEELTALKRSLPSPNSKKIISYLQTVDQLKARATQNKIARKQLELQFWVWDERKWPALKL